MVSRARLFNNKIINLEYEDEDAFDAVTRLRTDGAFCKSYG